MRKLLSVLVLLSLVFTMVFSTIAVEASVLKAPVKAEIVSNNIGRYVIVPGDGTIGYWKNQGQSLLTQEVAVFLNNFEVQLNRRWSYDSEGHSIIIWDSYFPFRTTPTGVVGLFSTSNDTSVFKGQVATYLKLWPKGSMADKLKAQYLCYILNKTIGYLNTVDFCRMGLGSGGGGLGWYYWDMFAVQAWQSNDVAIMERYKDYYERINSNTEVSFGVFASSPNWHIWFPDL